MDPSPEEITALADQLSQMAKALAASTDPKEKKLQTMGLVLQAKKMITQIQDPFDALMDHVVHAYTIAAALALMEIGVFEAVPMQGTATLKEVAEECKADEALIARLMRQLLCVGIFTSTEPGVFSHSRLSIGLSNHIGMTGKYFFEVAMDEMMPSMNRLNRYIRQYGPKDVTTYTETPHSWYDGKGDKNFWEVLSTDDPGFPPGTRIDRFSKGLSLFAAMHPVVAMFPFASALQPGNSESRPLCVDIGGGRGLAMLELRNGCPELKGELILQDRPIVLDYIPESELPGVTMMAHDFFTEQPVKNAQVYYIRRVMHDWQDEDASRILKAVVPAMARDSRILVSDMAMPDPVTLQDAGAVWMDLMMLTIGGRERTKTDWEHLGEISGLKLVKVWQEPMKFGPLCVVEYMLKDSEGVGSAAESAVAVEGTGSKPNGVTNGFQGSASEVALAENVQAELPGEKPQATDGSEPKTLDGVDAEARAYGSADGAVESEEQSDSHPVGLAEGTPVVVRS